MGRTLQGTSIVPAVARPRAPDTRPYTSWDRARLSVVVPIGVIVAVAIVCIVVAVLSSAQRADVVAVDHEKQLFSRAITNYGERVLREVESVASAAATIQNIRRSFDPDRPRPELRMLAVRPHWGPTAPVNGAAVP